MALPTIKVAISNGHFQESLQNFGDRGTWTSVGSFSGGNTVLTDTGANWVDDEWIGFIIVVDTNESNPTPATIVDNDSTSITVSGDHSGLTAGTDTYRIAGGVEGTVTANGTPSRTIALANIKNKWGTTVVPETNEFKNMYFCPDKLDGTSYKITSNNATTITLDGAEPEIAVTATSYEIGRGASATVYPESLNISAELNEPKSLSANVVYNVVGGFDDDDSITNAVQLGSLVRVTETTGNKTLFEGNIYESPVSIDPDQRLIAVTAFDRLALLDHTVIPVTTDDPSSYAFGKSTPVLESGRLGKDSNNFYLQTKGYQDYTYAPRPFAISAYSSVTAKPYASTGTSDGTWLSVQATTGSTGSTLKYATGGFLTGTPGEDQIEEGNVVIKLNSTPANSRVSYVANVNSDTQITTVDDLSWASGDYFVILSKNWQVGEGIESDSDYVTRTTASGTLDGFKIIDALRKELVAVADADDNPEDDPTKTKIYTGRNSTFASGLRDLKRDYNGRGWVLLIKEDRVEIAQYSGYLYDYVESKWYLRAYNDVPDTARNTRNDLTGNYDTGTFTNSITWADNTPVLEIYPNRLGVTPPKVFEDNVQINSWRGHSYNVNKPGSMASDGKATAVVPTEGVIQFSQGDVNKNDLKKVRAHIFSYDGDARSGSPDKGTDSSAIDITDIVQIAVTGLSNTSATAQDIISTSKLMGGAGIQLDTGESLDTGVKVNRFDYQAYGDSPSSIHPKELIEKLSDDAGLLFDLRYDDSGGKVIFKPLLQNTTADITLSTGSVTALTREKDVSDVFSASLVQVSAPRQSVFDPRNILQYGCNFNTASVPKSNAIPSDFSSGGYSTGTPPDFFWGRTYLNGLGPDIVDSYEEDLPSIERYLIQSVWCKNEWYKKTKRTSNIGSRDYARTNSNSWQAINSRADNGNLLPVITLWFRGGRTLKTLDDFQFTAYKCWEKPRRRYTFKIEVSADVDLTDPLGTGTWSPYNDKCLWLSTRGRGNHNINVGETGNCEVKNIKAIRILGAQGTDALGGYWAEGREITRRKSFAEKGWQTWGWNATADSTSNTSLAETFDVSNAPDGGYGNNRNRPVWNNNKQDASGIANVDRWQNLSSGDPTYDGEIKSGFETAIGSTDTNPGGGTEKAGYTQCQYAVGNFRIRGEGVYAMYVRVTKNESTKGSPERLKYSPSYKKIAGLGYKVNPIPLENFAETEAITIGKNHLDDKLRRYQARDYSLDGASPFVNSNNLPALGQTIKISDDGDFTGIVTSYEFSMSSAGARFDFRLEDYDRNKTAQYIQAR